jgi:hypothetical protein
MYRKQVTMIDDLMDLESQGPPSMMPNQSTGLHTDPDTSFTQKFIRSQSNGNGMGKLDEIQKQIIPYQPKPQLRQEIIESPPELKSHQYPQYAMSTRLHCVDIVNHIKDCPVCQKLYNNNEKNIYILVIVILLIIIALLVKKLIEK